MTEHCEQAAQSCDHERCDRDQGYQQAQHDAAPCHQLRRLDSVIPAVGFEHLIVLVQHYPPLQQGRGRGRDQRMRARAAPAPL